MSKKLSHHIIQRILVGLGVISIWIITYAFGIYGWEAQWGWALILTIGVLFLILVAVLIGIRSLVLLWSKKEKSVNFIVELILEFSIYSIIILHQSSAQIVECTIAFNGGFIVLIISIGLMKIDWVENFINNSSTI